LVGGVGAIDYITGYELGFSLFYLAPILLVTWFSGRPLGILTALLSAVVWLVVDMSTGQQYTHPLIPLWNAGIRFGFFLIIALMLSLLKTKMVQEEQMATIDHLTGIANRRLFFSLLQAEIQRAERYNHPFTLAYVDIDDFKSINDQHGHAVGDAILHDVAQLMKNSFRTVDTIARLAGDEFAILLPETDMAAARTVLGKIRTNLKSIKKKYNCAVTVSIGAVTFKDAPESIDDAIKIADDLMYTVKNRGKNEIASQEWTTSAVPS
jgi:diguanylate cyclase (GGDEF)-like protein